MAQTADSGIVVPYFQTDETRHRRKLAEWAKAVHGGHLPVTGTVTLAAGATTTTVVDDRAGVNSVVRFCPVTAKAASAASSVWVSTFNSGSFVLTHANSAAVDKTFRYTIFGT
ncbi:hypothetical protein [Paraburkholderia sediminicola]|uniref:hypothetical protein n=1 Tax=Paraburkholderia sediminicola TaxID=458836 RepID=UPI0038BB235F